MGVHFPLSYITGSCA